MQIWKDWKIGTRLGVLFGAILLWLIGAGFIGLNWLANLNARTTNTLQERFNIAKLSNDTVAHSTDNARITFQLFETTDPEEEARLNAENDAISRQIGEDVQRIEKSLSSPREKELFETVAQNRTAYVDARSRAKKLLLEKKHDQGIAVLTKDVIPALATYRASWVKFIDLQGKPFSRPSRTTAMPTPGDFAWR